MQARVPKFTANKTTLCILCTFKDDLSPLSRVSGAQILLSQCITADKRADKSCYIFQTTTIKMMMPMFSAGSESVDKIDELCTTRVILGLFNGNVI